MLKTINWETISVLLALFSAVAGATLWLASRIFNFGRLSQRLAAVEADIAKTSVELRGVRNDVTRRIDDLIVAVVQKNVTEAHSPRQLNAEGKRILQESGMQKIADDEFDDIVTKVRTHEPENAYQVEQLVLDAVQELRDEPDFKDRIESGAFRSGSLVDTVLYVGGIYVRDRVLAELGMTPEQIDD